MAVPAASDDLMLALDTSTATARVAVLDGAGEIRFAAEATADRHSGHVLPLCAQALEAVGLRPAGLAAIACGGGPGSFTGLRVGLAVAKGLALPSGRPLFLVSSLEALALDILTGEAATAVPCLDAGKGEVYIAAYARHAERLVHEVAPAVRLTPAAVAGWLAPLGSVTLAGNGAERHRDVLGPSQIASVAGPTAIAVGRLARLQRVRGEAADLEGAVPIYGRPPDITVKKVPG